jgi:hypothetical protein
MAGRKAGSCREKNKPTKHPTKSLPDSRAQRRGSPGGVFYFFDYFDL